MKRYLIFSLLLVLFFNSFSVFSQGIATVNPLTGSASADIPITTFENGEVVLPISINYRSGVRALDVEGTAGMGWSLNAGGQVSRVVRGLPDDISIDSAGNARYGWMHVSNTVASGISSFSILNNGSGNCANEASDISSIATSFPFNYDTEPDQFYVNAPGVSAQLIYNRASAKFVTLTNNGLLISYASDPASGLISSFTITNSSGIKYVFSSKATVKEKTDAGSTVPTYFTTKYQQYEHGIDYNSSWYLTSITDQAGNALNLTYASTNSRTSQNPVSIYMPGATTATLQYTLEQTVTRPLLQTISSNNPNAANQQLSFNWTTNSSTNRSCIKQIYGMGRIFNLEYSDVFTNGNTYMRLFLRRYHEEGCSSPIDYKFAYAGETMPNDVNYTNMLSDSSSVKVDYWGYPTFNSNLSLQPKLLINPSNNNYQRYAIYNSAISGGSYAYTTTNGLDRNSDPTYYNIGNLIGISYIGGGKTTIVYEPNSYVDVPSGQVVNGNGSRVKQLITYDGLDVARNIVQNYSYNDPSTGITSGRPTTLPVFAFTIPYNGSATGSSLWNNNTVVSDYDLSDEDHSILYPYFKTTQTGAGSTLNEFYLPATNWDMTATPACSSCSVDWAPTINIVSRGNCSASYGPIKNDIGAYPFVPNPNYDSERGLLKSTTSFDDSGNKTSEDSYTYQRFTSPLTITAFRYDNLGSGAETAIAYNKYVINYNTDELESSITKKMFNVSTGAQEQSSTTSIAYGTYHTNPIAQSTTNSDNSIRTTNTRYVFDYNATTGINANMTALYQLKQLNINVPIEKWEQVTRGGTTKTINATISLFKDFTPASTTYYLPAQELAFVQPDGTTSFTPFSLSSPTPDSQYAVTANYTNYDNNGILLTANDDHKNIKTSITNHRFQSQSASFSHAGINEIAFSDFDTDTVSPSLAYKFSISGSGSFAANGSHTGNAYGLGTSQSISKTIATVNPKVANYIFSIWINALSGGTFSISVSGSGWSTTKTVISGWHYYEIKIPMAGISSSFTLTASCNQSISVDDLLLYPDIARVSTASYDPTNGYLVAETNTNGVSAYYLNDKWGRILLAYDQDKNIIKKNSYLTSTQAGLTLATPTIYTSSGTAAIPTSFNVASSPSCLAPVTYTWDFGDGSATISGIDLYSPAHTYASAGSYTVHITVSHPVLGSLSSSTTVTIALPNLSVSACQSGVRNWSNITYAASVIVNCSPNPSDADNSYYTATVGNAVGTISYTWQISYNNGATWSTYSTGSAQTSVACSDTMASFKMRCQINTSAGQSATTNVLQFTALP